MPGVLAIERACFGRSAYPRGLFEEYAAQPATIFLVAETGRKTAGYILARSRRSELVSIAVDPSTRRSGVGNALLQSALRRLRRAGATEMSLIVKVTNQGAMRFYESFGFERIRRVRAYYEDGADGYLMKKG
ncbi:MAG: ribosomal protein S18-alanine N-acetyltransferase [Bryobacteraceae bacterium]